MSKISQELVPGDVVDGVMVVHGSHGDESYEMTRIPPPTAYLVQNAKKDILQDLGLQSVLTDLNRASDLLYLAYLGVIGTGDLHARISNRQKELLDVCGDCVLTMTVLKDACRSVLERLTEAYSYLLEANEPRALRIISRCADNAHTMATKCEELVARFGKLKDDTKKDAATATQAWGDQVEKVKELEKLRVEMECTEEEEEATEEQRTVNMEVIDADADNKKLTVKMLEKAKKEESDAKAGLSSAAVALDGVANDVRRISQEEAVRANIHPNNRSKMVKENREMEKLHRDAVGQLAACISRLESNTRALDVEKSSQTALEIVAWAFTNIFVSLINVKSSCDNMKTFWDKLADPKTRELIQDEVDDGASSEVRIKFYKSFRFVSPAVIYISRWAALANVCEEFAAAWQHARKSVGDHIRASPNAEEARQLIGPLKKQLLEELAEDAAQANLKIGELDAQAKQLVLEIFKIKADTAEEKPKEKSEV